MFSLFKSDPGKKLKKQHEQLLKQGMDAQRGGDMRLYAELTEKAEALEKEMDDLDRLNKR